MSDYATTQVTLFLSDCERHALTVSREDVQRDACGDLTVDGMPAYQWLYTMTQE